MNEHSPHTPSSPNLKHKKKTNLSWQYALKFLLDSSTTMLKIFVIALPTCLTRIPLTNHHSSIFLLHQEQNFSRNKHQPNTSHMKIWQPSKNHITIHQHCHCRPNLQNINRTIHFYEWCEFQTILHGMEVYPWKFLEISQWNKVH